MENSRIVWIVRGASVVEELNSNIGALGDVHRVGPLR